MPFVNMTPDVFKERLPDTMTARIQKRRADDNNDPRKRHKPEDEIELSVNVYRYEIAKLTLMSRLGHAVDATKLVATRHLETLGIRDESSESEADTVHSDMGDNVVLSVMGMEDATNSRLVLAFIDHGTYSIDMLLQRSQENRSGSLV
jgi:hypothetical protein